MDTRVFSAYNQTSKLNVCERLSVVDAAREPIKVLKILMEGIGPAPKSGLLLINFKGIPVARSQNPFDLIYLDIDSRVLQAVEISLHSVFEKFKGQPEAALVLPPQSINASKTFSGDRIALGELVDEAGPPIPEVARPAAPKTSTRIVPASGARSYNVPSKGTSAPHSGPLMRGAAAGVGKPAAPEPAVQAIRSEAPRMAERQSESPAPTQESTHKWAQAAAIQPTPVPVVEPKQVDTPAVVESVPVLSELPTTPVVPEEPSKLDAVEALSEQVSAVHEKATLPPPPHTDSHATTLDAIVELKSAVPDDAAKASTAIEVKAKDAAAEALEPLEGTASGQHTPVVDEPESPVHEAPLTAGASTSAETRDEVQESVALSGESPMEQTPPFVEQPESPIYEEPQSVADAVKPAPFEFGDEVEDAGQSSEKAAPEQPAPALTEDSAEIVEHVAASDEQIEPVEDTSPRLLIVSKPKPAQAGGPGTFVAPPTPLDNSLASLFSAGVGAPPAQPVPITPEEKKRNARVEALSKRWDVRFVYWLFPELRPSYRPDIEAPRIDPVKDMQARSKKKKKLPRKIRILSSLYPDLELKTLRQRQGRARRAPRIAVPGLVGFYYTGGTSFPYEIRNISVTGFYMLTDERWSPGTVIRVTLQMTESDGDNPGDTITIHARVVNWDETGAGFEFVLPGFME